MPITSPPVTKITSANPDAIYENAEMTAFVPELQRCSIVCEIFGFIPVSSERIALRYLELSLVDTNTPSIRSCDMLGVV